MQGILSLQSLLLSILQIFQALQSEIIQNKLGKFIPYIFIEWIHIPTNRENCPHFHTWVENFSKGGYISVDPGPYLDGIFIKLMLTGAGTMARIDIRDTTVIDLLWVHQSVINYY